MIRPTVATVSLEALAANLRAVRGLLARQASPPPGVIAVVKANAYGHGAGKSEGKGVRSTAARSSARIANSVARPNT